MVDTIEPVRIRGNSKWCEADGRLTRPADATPTVVGGAIGSSVSAQFKFSDFFEGFDASNLLTGMKLIISASGIAIPSSIGIRAHLYNVSAAALALSANADKGTHKTVLALAGAKLGFVDFTTFTIGGSGSDLIESYGSVCNPDKGLLHIKSAADARDLYVILAATTVFTPVNAGVHALFAGRSSL